MSTTARIYFVNDDMDPEKYPLDSRIVAAKHTIPIVLFCSADGYPRNAYGQGVLDRLERFLDELPRRLYDFEVPFTGADVLATQFLIWDWERPGNREEMQRSGALPEDPPLGRNLGISVGVTVPRAGSIIFYEYLVVVHIREKRKPTVFVRDPAQLWKEPAEFMAWLDKENSR